MNYCDKIHYNIYTTGLATFGEMVDALLAQLPQDEQILRLAFFGMPNDNEQYVSRRIMLREKIRKFYGNHEPVLSYVSQPPLNAGLILEVHSYKADEDDHITFRRHGGFPYVVLENADGRFLFAGGFHGDVINFGIQQQSAEVFHMMGEVMRREGFPVNCIIRQWNYIEQITRFDGPDQHYQMFNNARADFYGKTDWSNGYPAATGIGANLGGILVDLDAAVFARPECYATPIDNKLQIAAHAYSDQVLEAAQQKKATPKFERAKSMTFDDRRIVYISGTALLRCFRYVLQNPLKAGLCHKISEYRWNSYSVYFNPVDSFVSTEFLTLFFDSKADFQAYMLEDEDGEFMEAGYQFKDHEVRKLLEEMLEGKSFEILTKVEQRQVLKVLKQNPNIGLRQLARITGISLGIIHRL